MQETFVEFTFDAAHKTTPDTPLHGHTFSARVVMTGERDPVFGWSHDLLDVQKTVQNVRAQLDHKLLNEIEGLDVPSLENGTKWIWESLDGPLPGLVRVELRRGADGHAEGCAYWASARSRTQSGNLGEPRPET